MGNWNLDFRKTLSRISGIPRTSRWQRLIKFRKKYLLENKDGRTLMANELFSLLRKNVETRSLVHARHNLMSKNDYFEMSLQIVWLNYEIYVNWLMKRKKNTKWKFVEVNEMKWSIRVQVYDSGQITTQIHYTRVRQYSIASISWCDAKQSWQRCVKITSHSRSFSPFSRCWRTRTKGTWTILQEAKNDSFERLQKMNQRWALGRARKLSWVEKMRMRQYFFFVTLSNKLIMN